MKCIVIAVALILLAAPISAQVVGQAVRLLPQSQTVTVGDTFPVQVWCPAAADTFNGFGGAIIYDSTLVQPVSGFIGPYMQNACGSSFYDWHYHTGVFSFSTSTLCGYQTPGSNLTGPGLIFTLTFRAIGAGVTPLAWLAVFPEPYIQDPLHSGRRYRTGYLHGGPYIEPVVAEAAAVTITTPVGVAPAAVALPSDGKVYDVMGRRVDPAAGRSGITFGAKKRARVK